MSDSSVTFEQVKQRISDFNRARDWDGYHDPKELAVAISIESAELLEAFQWEPARPPAEVMSDARTMSRVRDETADLLIYILTLCNRLGLDASTLISEKMDRNELRFPPGQKLSFRRDR